MAKPAMNIRDVELTVPDQGGIITVVAHIKTKPPWRVKDGEKHPVVIIKEGKQ